LEGLLAAVAGDVPIALFPATSESEKISFNQINKTGHRIRYLKVDADTGEEVPNDDIIKGYQIDRDRYLEVTKDELENIALESTRAIEINEFVPRKEIDDLYLVRPYHIIPDGKIGHDAYAVIRETIRGMDRVAIGRVVLTNREHVKIYPLHGLTETGDPPAAVFVNTSGVKYNTVSSNTFRF
jgi:DNA end-binding protein Ku